VNGKVIVKLGTRVVWGRDDIRVDGRLVRVLDTRVSIALNKPKQVITSNRDPRGRSTTADLVKGIKARLFPVGRLDYHSEGLLLLTSDGELAHRLQHPRYGIPKTYRAKVKGLPSEETIGRLRSGVLLDGRRTAPAQVKKSGTTGRNTWLEITIREGRNRQIRRMCKVVGHPVMKLKRTRYGPVSLGKLKPGAYRQLTVGEMERLRNAGSLPSWSDA
jgi:pseudouridine synthase